MNLGNYPLSRKEQIVVQEAQDELLIYDLRENKALCLNQTSAFVWQKCDGTKSVAEIALLLSKKFKSPVSEDFVWLALQQFKKDNLLEQSNELTTPLDGLSRRDVIKRVGFASMVALPVVASVIAPTAVAAQSGGCGCFAPGNMANLSNPGCSCTGSSDCCGGSCGLSGNLCIAMSVNTGPACCPIVNCPPQNGAGIPPGCGCLDNANCASGNCIGNICSL